MMVTGTCILPTLNINKNEIKFAITEDDKKFEKKEALTLDNVYDYDIQYEWKVPTNSSFEIEPISGIIKANSQLQITIAFNFEELGEGTKI